jgi:hypothetical protein
MIINNRNHISRTRHRSGVKERAREPKERKTFTLSRESIALLHDLCVGRRGSRPRSVSAVLDDLLRALDRQRKRDAVERAITSYYDGLSEQARAGENGGGGKFSLAQFMDGTP